MSDDKRKFDVAVLPGDGNGWEVMPPALEALERPQAAASIVSASETWPASKDAPKLPTSAAPRGLRTSHGQ